MAWAASSALGLLVSHSEYRRLSQKKQWPQEIVNGTTTRSPFFRLRTSLPTSTTSPMNSWPSTSPGSMAGIRPL